MNTRVKLGELLTQVKDVEYIDDPGSEKYITISGRGNGVKERIIKDGKTPVPFSAYRVKCGQLIYSRIGASEGAFGIVPKELHGAVVSKDFPVFKVDEDRINIHYLVHYLTSSLFCSKVASESFGATMTRFKEDKLLSATIVIPSLTEQNHRVERLKAAKEMISMRQLELQLLDDLSKARFVELFSQGNYNIVKASEVCDFITKGTTPPTGEISQEYADGMIPFLKVYNLSFTGEMLFDDNPQFIPKETHDGKLARSKVYPNDVLMNIVGPPLGKFTIVTDEYEEWNINQAIAIFRAKERILPRFLLHALMQPTVLDPFIGQAVGIRQQNLSLEQCRNLQFPLPSIKEQKAFVDFAEQLDKSKVAVQKALEETNVLFERLMQQYFG